MKKPTIASEAARLIAQHGPMTAQQLAPELLRLGRTKARNPAAVITAALNAEHDFVRLLDGCWVPIAQALEGATLTHRLTELEVEAGSALLDPDFSPLAMTLRSHRFGDGGELEFGSVPWPSEDSTPGRRRVLVGPGGWLAGTSPGDLIGLRLQRGHLELIAPRQSSIGAASAIRDALTRAVRDHLRWLRPDSFRPGVGIADVVAEALMARPGLLDAPTVPLCELLDGDEFEIHGYLIGTPGTRWSWWDGLSANVDRAIGSVSGAYEHEDEDEGAIDDMEVEFDIDDVMPLDRPGVRFQPKRSARIQGTKVVGPIYQIRVSLKRIAPPIWRRVQVPSDITLRRLHRILQATMGWYDSHLHSFKIAGVEYGEPNEDLPFRDDRRARLSRLVNKEGTTFGYEYDFGDGWEHEILVERVLQPEPDELYPLYLDGRRACPPEDCGGAWGYQEFLLAMLDPRHEEHEAMLEWVGGAFDPESFDPELVNDGLAWAH